jgi:aminopeptidase N
MLLIIMLCAQWGADNQEAKYYQGRPGIVSIAHDSSHSYDVLKYEVRIRLPMTGRTMSGVNRIKCRSRQNGLNVTTLHSRTLTIDSVRVDGTAATYSAAGETLHINLPQVYNAGDTFFLDVGYHGSWTVSSYQTGYCFYPRNYNSGTLHVVAYSLGEPWDARQWMPCYDEPYDKADQGALIAVTVPAVISNDTLRVCANGDLVSIVLNPDSTKTFTWQENYPVATYLMHFGVSRFASWSHWYHPAVGDSIEIREFVWPNDSIQSRTACLHLPDAMALFDSLYGPYPLHRYGQDAVYPYYWGGMEHQEQTTIHRVWIQNSSENGMAHELSHQWWGDMVTCVDFRNIWLNEGFATYSDANYNWYRFGHANFINTMLSRASDYFSEDASSRRPLYDPPLNDIFSWGYSYCKGSWVVHMLRYLDQGQFLGGLQVYRDSFDYATANTEDLERIMGRAYGSDLSWFFDEWVYGQGYPEYNVYWYCVPYAGNYQIQLRIHQDQTNAPPVFHMPVQILLNTTAGDTLLNIPITSGAQSVQYTIGDSVIGIVFDPDNWILRTTNVYYGIEDAAMSRPGSRRFRVRGNPSRSPVLEYSGFDAGSATITVYEINGRLVRRFIKEIRPAGKDEIRMPGLTAGVYFVKLETVNFSKTLKVTVVE